LLINKETNLPIGECGFHTWNALHQRAEIFYNMFNENFKQKGFMKEALKKVLEYGFTELNLHRVEALIDEENQPSLKLLNHFGFVKEGIMREDYVVNGKNENSTCFSLLKWEWKNI
jgi:ribosomal-protein-alanine N-acetyltransferase